MAKYEPRGFLNTLSLAIFTSLIVCIVFRHGFTAFIGGIFLGMILFRKKSSKNPASVE